MLRKGIYDDVSLAGWGHLDELMAMSMGLGIYRILGSIEAEIREECSIPRLVICNALFFKNLLGEPSYLSLQEGLFKDPGLLQLMGCTARVIHEGFDSARNKGENKPFHVDSIRHFQKHIPEEELHKAWLQTVSPIALALKGPKGKKGVFILDATKHLVWGDYEGAGEQNYVDEFRRRDGTLVQTQVHEKGFKEVTLCLLRRGQLIVVAYRKISIRQHETTVAAELVEEGLSTLGEDAPNVILVDRGFMSGPLFFQWKTQGLDVVVPLRRNMNLLEDMQGLAKLEKSSEEKSLEVKLKDTEGKQTVIKAFNDLTTLDSYPGKLSGLLITEYKGKDKGVSEQWGFLTTLDIRTRQQALASYRNYDDRSLIENKAYRELKQGFELTRFPGLSARDQATHLFFLLLTFNLVALWRSGAGERYVNLGIRRLRRQILNKPDQVVVYVARSYAVMSLAEFVTHLGRPPSRKLDDVVKILNPGRRYTFSLNRE